MMTGNPLPEQPTKPESPRPDTIQQAKRLNRAFGPIVAGVIIDLLDLSTFGPMGLVLGLPLGGGCGYWMGRTLGLTHKQSLTCALAAGIYCTIPLSEFLPLATLVGAYARYREWDSKADPTPPDEEKPTRSLPDSSSDPSDDSEV